MCRIWSTTLVLALSAGGFARAAEDKPALPAPEEMAGLLRSEHLDLKPLLKSDVDLAPFAAPIADWLKDGAPTKCEPKVKLLESTMQVLARAGEKAADSAPLVRQYLLDGAWDSRELRLACAAALLAFGERGIAEAGVVVKDFKTERGPALWAVVHEFGAKAKPLLPALVDNLERTGDAKVQKMMWDVIAEFPPGCLDACTARLVKAIDDGKVPKHAQSPYQTVVRGTDDLKPYRKDILRWLKDEKHLHQGCDAYLAMALCSDDDELIDALACHAHLRDGADALAVASVLHVLRSPKGAKVLMALLVKDPSAYEAREALLGLAESGPPLGGVRKEVLQMLASKDEGLRVAAAHAIAVAREIDPQLSQEVLRVVQDAGAKAEALKADHLQRIRAEAEKVAEAKKRLAAEGVPLKERESYELRQTVKNEDAVRRKLEGEFEASMRGTVLTEKFKIWAEAIRARVADKPDEARAELWRVYTAAPRKRNGKPEWPADLFDEALPALLAAGKPGPELLGDIQSWIEKTELPEDRAALAGLLAAWDEGRADRLKVLEDALALRGGSRCEIALWWVMHLGKDAAPLLPALRQLYSRTPSYIVRLEAAMAIWQIERAMADK